MQFFDPSKPVDIRRGMLPHWYQEGALYFVTFRLFDSFPRRIQEIWRAKLLYLEKAIASGEGGVMVRRLRRNLARRYHRYLDLGLGSCVLRLPEVRDLVTGAIRHFAEERYQLDEFTVAANHVHALVAPRSPVSLPEVLHSWKSFTAHEILKMETPRRRLERAIGGKASHVWQAEGFDHLVRSAESLERFRTYIRNHKR